MLHFSFSASYKFIHPDWVKFLYLTQDTPILTRLGKNWTVLRHRAGKRVVKSWGSVYLATTYPRSHSTLVFPFLGTPSLILHSCPGRETSHLPPEIQLSPRCYSLHCAEAPWEQANMPKFVFICIRTYYPKTRYLMNACKMNEWMNFTSSIFPRDQNPKPEQSREVRAGILGPSV